MPEFLEVLFGDSTQVKVIYYGTLSGLALLIFWLFYRKFAPGPRRRRSLKQVRLHLAEGNWTEALKALDATRKIGNPSAGWQRRFAQVEAECLDLAMAAALLDKKFDQALEHGQKIAEIRGLEPRQVRLNVQNAMVSELRRLFSIPGESRSVLDLAARTLQVSSLCREAVFWQGMAYLRAGEREKAMESFLKARGGEGTGVVLDDELVPRRQGDALTPSPSPPQRWRGEQAPALPGAPSVPSGLPPTPFIDPSLYLGAVFLRQGKAKESLRFLTEANRLDANCPIVTILLGSAIVEAGGDTNMAVKALQRGLGPKGLQIWADKPARAWVEGFPEGRSYVRKLASNHPFHCPVFGGDFKFLQLQGMLALGQGLYKLNDYQEAANLFTKLIQEGAPSLAVVRGLGLSLARIGKYDEAFKHLRAAHEMEEPQERTTAGFLALCGAKGTPKSDEDKRRNLEWAIRIVAAFTAPGDEEWAALANAIFAEARAAHLPIAEDDQLYLAEHLLSINAADPVAAQALHHLYVTHPSAVRAEYAWLYCRAVERHRIDEPHTLDLFALAFADRAGLEAFYDARGWSARDVELAYLEKAAQKAPGRFPAALGEHYAPQGEALLRARSAELEKAGDLHAALAIADILGKLAPVSAAAQDRAADLYYRRGQIDQALEVLERWQAAHPSDALPLLRRALILHHQQKPHEAMDWLQQALPLADGKRRGQIYYLLAQIILRQPGTETETGLDEKRSAQARDYLESSLRYDPGHNQALCALAALRWLADPGSTASLASPLDSVGAACDGMAAEPDARSKGEPDPRSNGEIRSSEPDVMFFAALAHFAAGDHRRTIDLCAALRHEHPPLVEVLPDMHATPPSRVLVDGRSEATTSPERNGAPLDETEIDWSIEAAYLQGLAEFLAGDNAAARDDLELVARASGSPSAGHAQALLGSLAFTQGDFDEAMHWWHNLDQRKRSDWKIGQALGGTVFLTALEALHEGRYEEAAEKLRSAGKLGCRDRRLGHLLILSLFRAGQKAIYG